jgi:hypothetical protein
MRAVYILLAAVLLGLAGGWGWAALNRPHAAPRIPRAVTPKEVDLPQSASDSEWAARADDQNATALAPGRDDPTVVEQSVHYAGCNEVRAAGKAPLHAGEPGYRSDMDGDGDGIACEPIRPR